MSITRAKEILKHQFGYDSFRMNQQQAIETVLQKKDCVVLMPTGGGKSLCYQIPALMLDGLAVVISPLISLMKDQVDALMSNGVNAAFLNSTQSTSQQGEVFRAISNNKLKLLYVAPERLMQTGDQFIDYLKQLNVSLFAIDEAHCISSWGHDFRPEYMQLAKLKVHFPNIPVIALTATADKLVRQDIMEKLEMHNPDLFISSFNRPNIFYNVEAKRNSYSQLIDYLSKHRNDSGIIYCLSRNSVENLAEDLKQDGFNALPYHAGLERNIREKNQELFLKDEVKIIVATIAFGMGIDKSNVRFVVHMDLPKNVESYYQETGRAGRDGLQSEALLFFSWGDVIKMKKFAEVENNEGQTKIMLKKLNQMGEFGDLKTCRRKYLLNYFSEETKDICGSCDNCNTQYERFDGTIVAQKALSAVKRLEQRWGTTYVIDFLRGSKSEKIHGEHKEIKTYGVGADISKDNWFGYIKDLIAQGYLKQTDGQYPVLTLTEKSEPVLRGVEKVDLIKVKIKEEKKASLEKRLKEELNNLMHKTTFISRVEVEIGEDIIDINLYNKRKEIIIKDGLSKGEQQLYATALLKALVDESNIKFPVFIDSPLQKFDKTHSRNIICSFYPKVSDQVVLFPLLEKELSESEYDALLPKVSAAFLIKNIDEDSSTFQSIEPAKLFEQYKKSHEHVYTY